VRARGVLGAVGPVAQAEGRAHSVRAPLLPAVPARVLPAPHAHLAARPARQLRAGEPLLLRAVLRQPAAGGAGKQSREGVGLAVTVKHLNTVAGTAISCRPQLRARKNVLFRSYLLRSFRPRNGPAKIGGFFFAGRLLSNRSHRRWSLKHLFLNTTEAPIS
jgi:hypothetical protein